MLGGDLGDTAHYRVATGALGGVRLVGQHSIVTATPGMEDSPQSELSAYSFLVRVYQALVQANLPTTE